jgi:hypothetical protein
VLCFVPLVTNCSSQWAPRTGRCPRHPRWPRGGEGCVLVTQIPTGSAAACSVASGAGCRWSADGRHEKAGHLPQRSLTLCSSLLPAGSLAKWTTAANMDHFFCRWRQRRLSGRRNDCGSQADRMGPSNPLTPDNWSRAGESGETNNPSKDIRRWPFLYPGRGDRPRL